MNTTIAAISTAYGEAGIGVIRLSGDEAYEIALKLSGKKQLKERYMHYCRLYDKESCECSYIDEALVCFMKAPKSYTGEDVVEIQCHGSSASLRKLLARCLELGAVLAEPGEFTKRAFINGRLDLSQAEAVIDLIKARTSRSLGTASKQLEGVLSRRIKRLREAVKELLIEITVNMDYPDEDIEEITYKKLKESLSQINDEIIELLEQGEEGRVLREGFCLALIGKPNVGKSSLMNLFMGEDRSIVSSVAGTTRDSIEENAQIREIPVRIIDTAGIRQSDDLVEKIGIERSRLAFEKADLVLLVLDASTGITKEDAELIEAARGTESIILWNKTDIREAGPKPCCGLKLISTSFKTGAGFDELKDEIEKRISGASCERRREDPALSNIRHIDLLKKAEEELRLAIEAVDCGEALDLIEINASAAFSYLGEITGDSVSGEIIEEIFSRFCLGK